MRIARVRASQVWLARPILLPALLLVVFLSSGCDQARQDLLEWSRKNAIKRPSHIVPRKTSVAKRTLKARGCPEGLVPADDQAGYSGLCVAPEGNNNRFVAYYGNGRLKTEIINNEDALRISRFYETGKPKEVVHFRDNRKSGVWKEWYQTGDLKVKGTFSAGQKSGVFSYYHPNGKLHEQGTYRNDVRSGVWSQFAKNAKIQKRVTWASGVEQGNAEFFYDSGALREHGAYVGGKKHGRWVGYHKNGNRRFSGMYYAGQRNGEWLEFAENGRLASRKGFSKGTEVPRTHLAGTVPFNNGDVLGARTPQSLQGRYGARAPRKAPRPQKKKEKDSGWVSM